MTNAKYVKGLLVEDDPDDAHLFLLQMKAARWPSYQFDFAWAHTLREGVEVLSRGGIEVVLLDLKLPDSAGVESVRQLRAQFPEVPTIVLTGLRDEEVGLEALKNGAQDYQVKGTLEGDTLKRTISYAVERHRAQARIRDIIEKSADGIMVVDAKGLIRQVNPAAAVLFRCEPGELLGKPFEHAPSADRSEIRIPGGKAGEAERAAEMRVSEIEWEGDAARLVMIRDITELRRHAQLEAEVVERRKMDKLKDDLMSTVSHEMRNPLSIIKVAGTTIRDGIRGRLSKNMAEMFEVQQRNVTRLEKIVERVLELSRLESGQVPIQLQSVEIGPFIADAVRGFQLVAKEKDLVIRAELPADLPRLRADPELLAQLLTNLFDNAMRYARSRITIRAAAHAEAGSGGGVKISVVDDGKGVPLERQDGLFNKFVQVDRNSKGPGYKGTGLGLAICKEIVDRMDGRIWIESAEDRGAAFHFVIPRDPSAG